MKTSLIFFLAIIFLNCSNKNEFARTENLEKREVKNYPDSSVYWVNENYLKCLETNKSICKCSEENEWIILFLDTTKLQLIVKSSVFHFGLEQTEIMDLNKKSDKNYQIKSWRDSETVSFTIEDDFLSFSKFKGTKFVKKTYSSLDIPETPKGIFMQESDLYEQNMALNAKSILKYLEQDKSTFSQDLISLIHKNKVSINCSDDYFFNSLLIDRDSNQFFHLEYQGNKLILYDEGEGRARGEKIDTSKMKRRVFYSNKK